MLQNKKLIAVVVLLVIIKFVLLPLQQKQQELHQQLDSLVKRVQRSEALVQEKDTLQKWAITQEQELTQLLQPFPVVDNAAQYRLTLQQQLQQLAVEHQVAVTFFDWLSDTTLNIFEMQRSRISLRVEGEAAAIMLWHAKLEQRFPQLVVRDVRATWPQQLTQNSRVEVNLLIEVDYQLKDES